MSGCVGNVNVALEGRGHSAARGNPLQFYSGWVNLGKEVHVGQHRMRAASGKVTGIRET